jgi:hypothetical protein
MKPGDLVKITKSIVKNLYSFHGDQHSAGESINLLGKIGTIIAIYSDDEEAPPYEVRINDLPPYTNIVDFYADEIELI